MEEQPDMKVVIGIDDKCRPYTMMHISYSKAYKALQSCLRTKGEGIRFYSDINMEIFTDEISDMSKKEYVQKLFSGYEREELAETVGLLETLYDLEGSITAAAEKLHMLRTPFNINYEESTKEQAMILALFVGLHYSILPLIFIEKSET